MTLRPPSNTAQRILAEGARAAAARTGAGAAAGAAAAGARHVTRGTAARTQSAKQFFLDVGKKRLAGGPSPPPKTLVYASSLQKPTFGGAYSTSSPKKFGGGDAGLSTSNDEFQFPAAAATSTAASAGREFRIMSPSRTVQSFEVNEYGTGGATTFSSSATATYEFDYDEDNLHMSPAQTTSMDYEDNAGCDSLGQDDVMDVRDARRAWDAEVTTSRFAAMEPESLIPSAGNDWYGESGGVGGCPPGTDFVETEEDWEIMHSKGLRRGRRADAEDGDVVIDW